MDYFKFKCVFDSIVDDIGLSEFIEFVKIDNYCPTKLDVSIAFRSGSSLGRYQIEDFIGWISKDFNCSVVSYLIEVKECRLFITFFLDYE